MQNADALLKSKIAILAEMRDVLKDMETSVETEGFASYNKQLKVFNKYVAECDDIDAQLMLAPAPPSAELKNAAMNLLIEINDINKRQMEKASKAIEGYKQGIRQINNQRKREIGYGSQILEGIYIDTNN